MSWLILNENCFIHALECPSCPVILELFKLVLGLCCPGLPPALGCSILDFTPGVLTGFLVVEFILLELYALVGILGVPLVTVVLLLIDV